MIETTRVRHSIAQGSLVKVVTNDLGPAKLVGYSGDMVEVEYFYSVARRERVQVAASSVVPVRLEQKTRVYMYSQLHEGWLIGRIDRWIDSRYEVHMPNRGLLYKEESEIYVRCYCPIDDPAELLAAKAFETPFFHRRRSQLVHWLIEQRAVSRGMSGLLSANVHLLAHQVEVVRRVLEDPIQRYLLADEVGLGKTIEAGAILRQFLLDETQGDALVVVPGFLLEQWRTELFGKLSLGNFKNRIHLMALEQVERDVKKINYRFVIFDEAHHVAALAAKNRSSEQARFQVCCRLAHGAEHLLLLSATPVLNNEQDFLGMLHLLDPATYKLNDLEAFRVRVQRRQEIGRMLLAFRENLDPFVLARTSRKLKEVFADDALLQQKLTPLLTGQIEGEEQNRIVRSVHSHIAETYRLHRRMLRNRRESLADLLPPRFDREQRRRNFQVEYDLDERPGELIVLLEQWCLGVVAELDGGSLAPWLEIFTVLVCATGTWLAVLNAVLDARSTKRVCPQLAAEFGQHVAQSLAEIPLFDGEEAILAAMQQVIACESEMGDRFEHLRQVIERNRRRNGLTLPPPKMVVFTGFKVTGIELVTRLRQAFGEKVIASHLASDERLAVERSLETFRCRPECCVLVCDPSGEEGRNLQFADILVHFDLPWSPNRLEQRIGRLDRIGRRLAVQSVVFPGAESSLNAAWFELMRDGFGVFERSIASLQFYVDEKLPILAAGLLHEGIQVCSQIGKIREEIAVEQVRIQEQNALDEIDVLDQQASDYFNQLCTHDANHLAMRKSIDGWLQEALKFGAWEVDTPVPDILRYGRNSRTLVPNDDIHRYFAPFLEKEVSFSRDSVQQKPGTQLLRAGHGLIDALSRHIRLDDRGQAFALWRLESSRDPDESNDWTGFRFDFVVETDLEGVRQVLLVHALADSGLKAVKRLADSLFPPHVETLFIDSHLQIVEDRQFLKVLQAPAVKGRDTNLTQHRHLIDTYISADAWPQLCIQAKQAAQIQLQATLAYRERSERATALARHTLDNRLTLLRLRLERQPEIQQALLAELRTEEAVADLLVMGIESPRLTLDSTGFFVVSGRLPNLQEEE